MTCNTFQENAPCDVSYCAADTVTSSCTPLSLLWLTPVSSTNGTARLSIFPRKMLLNRRLFQAQPASSLILKNTAVNIPRRGLFFIYYIRLLLSWTIHMVVESLFSLFISIFLHWVHTPNVLSLSWFTSMSSMERLFCLAMKHASTD